jgi:hypothetical protein
MFEGVNFTQYEPHIDFVYTTLLMLWGGSLAGIGMLAVPYIFGHIKSRDEASDITTAIFLRQDNLIRVIAICMLFVFYFKSKLGYAYQHFEWAVYIIVLHFFIIGKILSRWLRKVQAKIDTFDTPAGEDNTRRKFHKLHMTVRYLYIGQFIGVVVLLYLHAFGLQ